MARQKVTATPEGAAIRDRAIRLLAHSSPDRVIEQLRREGMGTVSRRTLYRWRDEAAASPDTGERVADLSADVAAALASPEASEARQGDDRTDLDVLLEHDRQIEGRLLASMADEHTKRWTDLVTLRMRLRAAIARMRPPPPRDRETDPLSLEARDLALARIRRAIELAGGPVE